MGEIIQFLEGILIVINGWETHRALEYGKKKKKKIMLDIFLHSTCRVNYLLCILVNLHSSFLAARSQVNAKYQ